MGIKLRRLVTNLLSPSPPHSSAAAAHDAVLRATAHHPSTSPPSPRHLEALLAFGHCSRLAAAALAGALAGRLRDAASGHGDAAVALKSLLAVRLLLSCGAFILHDQLLAALLRHPSSGRNPLALAAFPLGRSASSFAAASWVRFYARVLELLLLLPERTTSSFDSDRLASLPNPDLVGEIAAFAAVAEAIRLAPPPSSAPEGNRLIWESIRLTEQDRVAAEREIVARVREMSERVDSVRLADAVELVCVLKKLEECAKWPSEWKWTGLNERVVDEIRRLREQVEEGVLRRGEEERRIRREAVSASARAVVPVRLGSGEIVRFGSTRWGGSVARRFVTRSYLHEKYHCG